MQRYDTILEAVIYFALLSFQKGAKNTGVIKAVKLVLHGTKELPDHVHRAGGARIYDNNYNKVIDEREVILSEKTFLRPKLFF